MDSIVKITDKCLKMKPNELWSWEKWAEDIVGLKVPAKKTYAYEKFISARNKFKAKVNKELARRNLPERVICVGGGKGVYLVNEKAVADTFVETKVRRFIRAVENSNIILRELSGAKQLSLDDKKMLTRVAGAFELQGNTLIGTISRMKSLPKPIKARLLKDLGIEPI